MASLRRKVAYALGLLYVINVLVFFGLHSWSWAKTRVYVFDVTGTDENSTSHDTTNGIQTYFRDHALMGSLDKEVTNSTPEGNITNWTQKEVAIPEEKNYDKFIGNVSFLVAGSIKPNETVSNISAINDTSYEKNVTKRPKYLNINPIQNSSLEHFSSVMSPEDVCRGREFLVTIITTKHSHSEQRKVIRDTWKSVTSVDGKKIVSLFLLGKGNHSEEWKTLQEFRKFHDIVSFDFDEHYLNLTLKTLMGLKWARQHCPSALYILKTDDDVFVNYQSLVRNLTGHPRAGVAMGHISRNSSVIRDGNSKWYTSKDAYRESQYPDYLQGTGYVVSKDVADKILEVSASVPFLNWEDAYVGICMNKTGVKLIHDRRFDHNNYVNRLKTKDIRCPVHYIFTIHSLNVHLMSRRWKRFVGEGKIAICRKLYPPGV